MALPNTGAVTTPQSVAGFWQDPFTYDQLIAGEVISQSVLIAPSLGILKRGQVLYGPTSGPLGTLNLTPTSQIARAILAQDINTGTGSAVTGLVYTQGKFLDTAITFGAGGAANDVAQLWDSGIYVMSVQQRSGILVPIRSLPGTGGPLPQSLEEAEAETKPAPAHAHHEVHTSSDKDKPTTNPRR